MSNVYIEKGMIKLAHQVHTHIYTQFLKLHMVLSSNQSPVTSVIPSVLCGVHFYLIL